MSILETIKSPADVKRLSEKETLSLAGEIRNRIIETAAKNGGHLASNLGMVDAEIAIHRVFSAPEDKIIFDVGHQAYAHKLITGRSEIFDSLRKNGGMSGFTCRTESEYDTVTAGHSGTALSTAVGIAEAERLAGRETWTVAVIGDGSFTNGMVYEALNQLSGKNIRLVLLLNDNAMSISQNVGGLSDYFSNIRTSSSYFSFKMKSKKLFMAVPGIGKGLVACASAVKDFLKRLVGAETWFESMGLEYIGPVDGNDIHKLTAVLEEAKLKKSPVVVHMITKKGLGYFPAEEHPEKYHSTYPFSIDDGKPVFPKKRTFSDVFSEEICKRAESDRGIVAVTAAMADGCGLADFSRKYPDRFYDVGIAEEHAVTFSSGLALGGKDDGIKPVLVMYSTFSQRVFDQLWHDFCLQNAGTHDLSLTLMLSHAGFVTGDGVTHQGIYDVALLSRLPEAEIWSPDTFDGMRAALDLALSSRGLTVIRYPKDTENVYGVDFCDNREWKSTEFDGSGLDLVVTYGRIAKNAVAAAKAHSEKTGRRTVVAVLERIVPLPDDARLDRLVDAADKITFVEEGIMSGGVGEAFAAKYGRKVKIIAVAEPLIKAGTAEEIEKRLGLDPEAIEQCLAEQEKLEVTRPAGSEETIFAV